MTEPTCRNCDHVYREDMQTLRCRRYPPVSQSFLIPPQVVGGQPGQIFAVHFPQVHGIWSCGEHKPRPNFDSIN
jgi:hypothetical protein